MAESRQRINMNVLWWLFLLTLTVTLGGCATISESECSQRDWYAIGYQDGTAGRGDGRMVAHSEACVERGVSLDLKWYYEGRNKGLHEFCTPSRGLSYGRSGAVYQSVCPIELESDFLTGYRLGRARYERNLYKFKHDLPKRELPDNVRKIDRFIEETLARDVFDAGERVRNASDLYYLESEYRRLEFDRQNLEREADRLKDE